VLVAVAKFLVAATKKLFVVLNFVAVTKPFFSVYCYRFLGYVTCNPVNTQILIRKQTRTERKRRESHFGN